MSGPITPPLTVTTVGGTPSGRPITTIKVSDGDLSISGGIATIDTSGSGGSPGGSTTEVQYNNAGAFAGDAGFFVASAGGGDTTKVRIGALNLQNNSISPRSGNDGVIIKADGSGEIGLQSSDVNGGTWTDSIVRIMCNTNADDAYLKFRSQTTSDDGGLMKDGNQDIILRSLVTNKDIDLQVNGTGQVEVQNTTTDTDTTLSVKGNGTGDAIINLNNPSKAVSLICDTNQKLKVQGGLNSFVFDSSSATGGITFPDTTELISAEGTAILATGITDGYVLTADGAGASGWEAAGGGSVNFPLPLGGFDATYKYLNIGTAAPYGVNTGTVPASEGDYALNTRPRAFPFIAPASAAPVSIYVVQNTTGTGTATVGIYSTNSDNYPDTLVATGTYDPTSTGNKTITNTLSTALVAGEMYYFCVRCDNNGGNLDAIGMKYIPSIFPSWRINENDYNTCLTMNNITSGTALLATAAFGSGNPSDVDRPQMWLEF